MCGRSEVVYRYLISFDFKAVCAVCCAVPYRGFSKVITVDSRQVNDYESWDVGCVFPLLYYYRAFPFSDGSR